jgi:hypothetical protein
MIDYSNRARQDADDLYKAGAGKLGTDEKTFNAIFARRSYYQLRATFEEYQRVNYPSKNRRLFFKNFSFRNITKISRK